MASPPFCLPIAPTKAAIVKGSLARPIRLNPGMQTVLGFHPFGPLRVIYAAQGQVLINGFFANWELAEKPVEENPTSRELAVDNRSGEGTI
jgi:hypothetical protein